MAADTPETMSFTNRSEQSKAWCEKVLAADVSEFVEVSVVYCKILAGKSQYAKSARCCPALTDAAKISDMGQIE